MNDWGPIWKWLVETGTLALAPSFGAVWLFRRWLVRRTPGATVRSTNSDGEVKTLTVDRKGKVSGNRGKKPRRD